MRSANLIAMLAASCVTGFAVDAYAAEGVGFDAQSPGVCASGYHPDATGNCEPDVAEVNRFCPPGQVYHPAPNGGWYCETPETLAQPQPQRRVYHATRERERPHATHPARSAHLARRRVAATAPPTDQTRSINSGLGAPAAPINPGFSAPPVVPGGGGGVGGGAAVEAAVEAAGPTGD